MGTKCNSKKGGDMYSSVISRSVFIVIALLVLGSCDNRESKVEADKAKRVKSETISRAKPATKDEATHNSRVASTSTRTTTKNVVYNGITQFNTR
jgi:hypothetical protein